MATNLDGEFELNSGTRVAAVVPVGPDGEPAAPLTPGQVGAIAGAADDPAYDDATGTADGTVISLLKGIYVQLAIIATNTAAP